MSRSMPVLGSISESMFIRVSMQSIMVFSRSLPMLIIMRVLVPMFMFIPGHALHEKGLQRQKGVGPLVSSQEKRELLILLINR